MPIILMKKAFIRLGAMIAIASVVSGQNVWAQNQTQSSAQTAAIDFCKQSDAESCFYRAVDFAQGKGVPKEHLFANRLFLMACDKGVPDGCYVAGKAVHGGWDNVPKSASQAADLYARSCRMGHVDSCDWAYRVLANGKATKNIARAGIVMEAGCAQGVLLACANGAHIFYDGKRGEQPELADVQRAGPLAAKACDGGHKPEFSCILAEAVYLNPESPAFEPEKGVRYGQKNCDSGVAKSCSGLGSIYHMIEDYETGTPYFVKACEMGKTDVCDTARDWTNYLNQVAAYEAEIAAENAVIDPLLNARQYGQAVSAAINQLRSAEQAERTMTAAINAGAVRQVNTADLYVIASWFRSGPIHDAADRVLAGRGTGLEGTFGTGTNAPGMAAKRYKDLYGSSMPSRSVSSSPSAPSGPSISDVREQARRDFKAAHCNMNSSRALRACQ
jgi:TPR repeat protein